MWKNVKYTEPTESIMNPHVPVSQLWLLTHDFLFIHHPHPPTHMSVHIQGF